MQDRTTLRHDILVRPSGTEPLLRIYFESNSEEKLEKLKQEVEKIL